MDRHLTLYRASAGSGKTYQLAKKFIWLLMTAPAPPRLRTRAEMAEVLPGILAITFTNKATTEMKERIVNKLADMTESSGIPDNKVDYLLDFAEDLQVDPKLIRQRAQDALEILLFGYSNFNISTIDSFFQTILRAFAYETNLKSGYQVEIESDFVQATAVDSTLAEVNRGSNSEVATWLRKIIAGRAGVKKDWNIFQKGSNNDSPYASLLGSASSFSDEKYQNIAHHMRDYFESNDYLEAFERWDRFITSQEEDALKRLQELGKSLIKELGDAGIEGDLLSVNAVKGWKKILNHKRGNVLDNVNTAINSPIIAASKFKTKGMEPLKEVALNIDNKYRADIIDAYENHAAAFIRVWNHLRNDLVNLGLSDAIDRHAREWLESNNLVELAQTNMILKRIISDEDTPFIYEKVGGRINNFLIDEFQDTSDLQWHNLRPLVQNSLASSNDNLIIGDAKQSIYRFRNANMNLIADTVPNVDFPDDAHIEGREPEKNANHRSAPEIIRLNNTIFSLLPSAVSEYDENPLSLTSIYSDAVQNIPESTLAKKEQTGRGYAEFSFLTWTSTDTRYGKDQDSPIEKRFPHLLKVGDIIHDATCRGYRMKDIAILVRKTAQARLVIEALMKYNVLNPDKRIEVISDESLLVNSSSGVKSVVEVLRMLVQPAKEDSRDASSSCHRLNADEIATNFNYYLINLQKRGEAGDFSRAEALEQFLANPEERGTLGNMIDNLQAMTLTAVVESIIGNFLSEEERRRDVSFLAAFQDAVIEFSNSKGSDIPAFLEWWDTKKENLSIASPKGTDAVNIMTIHKAKGLEFKVVMMPFLEDSLSPRNLHKAWVPSEEYLELLEEHLPTDTPMPPLPPYLPLQLKESALEGTPWIGLLADLKYENLIDTINIVYVGFTRAVDELYVWCKYKDEKSELQHALLEILRKLPSVRDEVDENQKDLFWDPDNFYDEEKEESDGTETIKFTLGRKMQKVKKNNDEKETATRAFEIYTVNLSHPKVVKEGGKLDDENEDPRSRGTRLHEIMAKVRNSSDLRNAIRRYRTLGKISMKEAKEFEVYLSKAISNPRVSEFFSERYEVINERELLAKESIGNNKTREIMLRPDRIMIDVEDPNRIVVLDYKFGNREKADEYRKQIGEYVGKLRMAYPEKKIEGLIWYVESDILEIF